jgi:hypothetical protein
VTAQPAPLPVQKFFDNNGNPLAFGLLYSYAAGTSTPQATYPDSTQTTPNQNPIPLNFRGEAAVWLNPALAYKLNLTDQAGNQIAGWPQDNIQGALFIIYVQTLAEAALGVVPTSSNYAPLNVLRYGADPTGIADSTAAIQIACNVANQGNGGRVYLPTGLYKTSSTITRQANVYIVGDGPGFSIPGTGYTSINCTGNCAIIASTGTATNVINGGGVQNLCLNGTWGSNNTNTASVGIADSFTNRAIHRDLRIHGCYRGMYGIGVWQVDWYNIQADGGGTQQNSTGFYLDQLPSTLPPGTSNAVNAVNCTAQGVADTGFRLLNPNGSKFLNCEAENGNYGFSIGNTSAGMNPIQFFQAVNCTSDTNAGIGLLIQQGSNASPCTYMQFSNFWTSTHGLQGVFLAGCQQINLTNGIAGNNQQGGITLNQCVECVISGYELINNNQSNSAGIGDITLSGGSFNKIIGNMSSMANSTSVSLLETNSSNNNTIEHNTLQQGATLIGAGTRAVYNQGYNPVGVIGPTTVGASPATITAGQSPETHYITQSATNTANVAMAGKVLGILSAGTTLVVQLDPGGAYLVTWTTTAPTYVKAVH